MQMNTRLHECLEAGRPAFGGLCFLNSPLAAELLANTRSLDFLAVDMQHGAIGVQDSVNLLRAMQSVDPAATPLVRVPTQDKYWVEQSLDAGYMGLIVPLVESADQAAALARAAYYPPKGARSYAGTIRASFYDGYTGAINDRLLLLPQIESLTGLGHCEEIAAVPGVSGLLFGPADLSLSCGWPLSDAWGHTPFADAVQRIVRACSGAGKLAATFVGGLDSARKARDAGFGLIAFAADGVELRVHSAPRIKRELEELRKEAGRRAG